MTEWLRLSGEAGRTNWFVVLMPSLRGTPAPKVEKLSATAARITLGAESETVHLGSDGKFQAAVERGGKTTVLLGPRRVRPWSQLDFKPIPPGAGADSPKGRFSSVVLDLDLVLDPRLSG